MRSPEISALARRGRQEPMGRNPVTPEVRHGKREPMDRNQVTPEAMDLSRPLSTKRPATTRRRPSCMARLITGREFIMVRAGVGAGGGGGDYRCTPSAADSPPSTGSTAPVR